MFSDDGGAIGVFDSGVGGLTVVGALASRLPGERVVYLGDTARVPYGTKSRATVVRYARVCADILLKRGVKILVVACNTASAFALEELRSELDVPVLGVIEPGARMAVERSKSKRVGVIGTRGTISSGEYQSAISRLAPEAKVFVKACPLFVPLAEEGWVDGDVPRRIAKEYLAEFEEHRVDTLVLGCTHYPLLKETIASTLPAGTVLVDSAEATSLVVEELLEGMGGAASDTDGRLEFLVSDSPERFVEVGESFLGRSIDDVEWVDF